MLPVLAGTAVLEKALGNLDQAKSIVKLPVGEKSSVCRNLGTMEFELEATVGRSGHVAYMSPSFSVSSVARP